MTIKLWLQKPPNIDFGKHTLSNTIKPWFPIFISLTVKFGKNYERKYHGPIATRITHVLCAFWGRMGKQTSWTRMSMDVGISIGYPPSRENSELSWSIGVLNTIGALQQCSTHFQRALLPIIVCWVSCQNTRTLRTRECSNIIKVVSFWLFGWWANLTVVRESWGTN